MRNRFPLVLLALSFLALGPAAAAQSSSYQYHVVGNPADAKTRTGGGLMLMGGGTDVSEAFRWMIERSGGGDFVVIRASGSDAYNPFVARLGTLDSVETIIFKSRDAADDPFVLDKIRNAEALFIAGGDQYNYVRYWKSSPVQEAIHHLVRRRVPIGGTSAGLAVLGEFLFPAEKDTIRSDTALADPFHDTLRLDRKFLALPSLRGVITDSHFVERDRMGRLLAFLSRLLKDGWAKEARGIGIDRETAVVIDPAGEATVIGKNAAYFLRAKDRPAVCEPGRPLSLDGVEVFKAAKAARFDLKSWSGSGGASYRISVREGRLLSSAKDGNVY